MIVIDDGKEKEVERYQAVIMDCNNVSRKYFYTNETYENHMLFGFMKSIIDFVKAIQTSKMYFCFDSKAPSAYRKEIDPNYKGTRVYDEKTDEFYRQLYILVDILKCLNARVFIIDGVEADDIIFTIAKKFNNNRIKHCIISEDKDFNQCLSQYCDRYRMRKNILYTIEEFEEEYGFPPSWFTAYQTLLGDSADNIKGLNGIGKSTGMKLIKAISEYSEATGSTFLETLTLEEELTSMFKLLDKASCTRLIKVFNESKIYKNREEVLEIIKKNLRLVTLLDNIKIPVINNGIDYEGLTKILKDNKLHYFLKDENLSILESLDQAYDQRMQKL